MSLPLKNSFQRVLVLVTVKNRRVVNYVLVNGIVVAPATNYVYTSYGGIFDGSVNIAGVPAAFNEQLSDVSMHKVVMVLEPTSVVNTDNLSICYPSSTSTSFTVLARDRYR